MTSDDVTETRIKVSNVMLRWRKIAVSLKCSLSSKVGLPSVTGQIACIYFKPAVQHGITCSSNYEPHLKEQKRAVRDQYLTGLWGKKGCAWRVWRDGWRWVEVGSLLTSFSSMPELCSMNCCGLTAAETFGDEISLHVHVRRVKCCGPALARSLLLLRRLPARTRQRSKRFEMDIVQQTRIKHVYVCRHQSPKSFFVVVFVLFYSLFYFSSLSLSPPPPPIVLFYTEQRFQ